MAGVRRASIATTAAVGDVAAHEIASKEEDEGEEYSGDGGVGGSGVLCQEKVEVVVEFRRQMFEKWLCEAIGTLLEIGGPSLKI